MRYRNPYSLAVLGLLTACQTPGQLAEKPPTNPTGAVMGTFDIRQISVGGTQVAYRSIYGGPDSEAGGDAKEISDRCARP